MRELATGLRILGVLSCATHDIDLSRCPCWVAMTRDEGQGATRLLRRSLPEITIE